MLKQCVLNSGIKTKQCSKITNELWQIDSFNAAYDTGICFMVQGLLIPICQNRYKNDIIKLMSNIGYTDLLAKFKKDMRTSIDRASQGSCNMYNQKEAELYGLKKESDVAQVNWLKIQAQKDKEIMCKQQEKLTYAKQLAAIQLESAITAMKNNLLITGDELELIAKHYNITIPINVIGWIRKYLINITNDTYTTSKRPSKTILKYYRQIQTAVKS